MANTFKKLLIIKAELERRRKAYLQAMQQKAVNEKLDSQDLDESSKAPG